MQMRVAPTLRESKGRRPKNRSLNKGLTQISRAGIPKRPLVNCQSRVRLLKQRHRRDLPRSRGVGTPSWAGPLTTSLRGLWVSGYTCPVHWRTERKGGDPRTDQASKGADSKLPGWQPKENEA